MVTRGTYFDEDEHYARRYSNRGHGYQLNQLSLERDLREGLPPAPHHGPYARQNMPSHNLNLNNRQSPEQDANSTPRRRIPVACGRCRKRKIRCSGDPGNGLPCVNCKTAGNDSCQFLRVSSTEAQMKNDGTDFAYDSSAVAAVSRTHCRMTPYGGPQHQPYSTHAASLGPDTYFSNRQHVPHSSMSVYQPTKIYSGSYNDFPDDTVDYGMPAPSYSMMNQDSMSIPYNGVGSGRLWDPRQLPKSNSLFVDDLQYGHGQLPTYTASYPYRSSVSSDSKSMSFQGMANALSPSVNSTNDRVLPAPAPISFRTSSQVNGSFLRPTENNLPLNQVPMYSNNGLMSANMANSVKALSTSSSSDSMSSSAYQLPLSSSPSESIPSSISYGNSVSSATPQSHDSFPSHLEPQPLDHTYPGDGGYVISPPSNSGSHRAPIGSPNGEDSHSRSNGSSFLINGQPYMPPPSDQSSYPQPPLVNIPSRMPEQSTTQSMQRQPINAT